MHAALLTVAVALLAPGAPARAQESPVDLAVYGGTCSVLMVNDVLSPKACLGTLMVSGFAGGRRTVIFRNADDEAIAFVAMPRQGIHYGVASVEVNGQSMSATGTCIFQQDAQRSGEIRCEARANGHTTSGTFQVTELKHEIGGQP